MELTKKNELLEILYLFEEIPVKTMGLRYKPFIRHDEKLLFDDNLKNFGFCEIYDYIESKYMINMMDTVTLINYIMNKLTNIDSMNSTIFKLVFLTLKNKYKSKGININNIIKKSEDVSNGNSKAHLLCQYINSQYFEENDYDKERTSELLNSIKFVSFSSLYLLFDLEHVQELLRYGLKVNPYIDVISEYNDNLYSFDTNYFRKCSEVICFNPEIIRLMIIKDINPFLKINPIYFKRYNIIDMYNEVYGIGNNIMDELIDIIMLEKDKVNTLKNVIEFLEGKYSYAYGYAYNTENYLPFIFHSNNFNEILITMNEQCSSIEEYNSILHFIFNFLSCELDSIKIDFEIIFIINIILRKVDDYNTSQNRYTERNIKELIGKYLDGGIAKNYISDFDIIELKEGLNWKF